MLCAIPFMVFVLLQYKSVHSWPLVCSDPSDIADVQQLSSLTIPLPCVAGIRYLDAVFTIFMCVNLSSIISNGSRGVDQ